MKTFDKYRANDREGNVYPLSGKGRWMEPDSMKATVYKMTGRVAVDLSFLPEDRGVADLGAKVKNAPRRRTFRLLLEGDDLDSLMALLRRAKKGLNP